MCQPCIYGGVATLKHLRSVAAALLAGAMPLAVALLQAKETLATTALWQLQPTVMMMSRHLMRTTLSLADCLQAADAQLWQQTPTCTLRKLP